MLRLVKGEGWLSSTGGLDKHAMVGVIVIVLLILIPILRLLLILIVLLMLLSIESAAVFLARPSLGISNAMPRSGDATLYATLRYATLRARSRTPHNIYVLRISATVLYAICYVRYIVALTYAMLRCLGSIDAIHLEAKIKCGSGRACYEPGHARLGSMGATRAQRQTAQSQN